MWMIFLNISFIYTQVPEVKLKARASESRASSLLECYAECSRGCKNWKLVPARAEHQACLNAMPSAAEVARIESSNSAFCSSGIAARHCLNKAFCIIKVDLINCLCLYCLLLHSGSSCQLPEGKPIERVCISGLSFRSLTNALVKLELGTMLCSIYAR